MDFSVEQKGNTRFMYVLPTSPTEALLEYTLFSKELLSKEEYEAEIEKYLQQLGISHYTILEKEIGRPFGRPRKNGVPDEKLGVRSSSKNQYTRMALLASHCIVLGGPTNRQSEITLFFSLYAFCSAVKRLTRSKISRSTLWW